MFFQRIAPTKCLEQIIVCYWIADDESVIHQKQKIIPDGFAGMHLDIVPVVTSQICYQFFHIGIFFKIDFVLL